MAWKTPKTDWAANDVLGPNDFNRIEGNTLDNHQRLNGHLNDKNNPHNVTTAQIGAVDVAIDLYGEVDLNTVVKSGFYRIATSQVINGPSGENVGWSQLIVSKGGDTIGQIIITYGTNKHFGY